MSYRSKSKIAAELGVTRRTVIRACNALESLGVIKQYELKRHNGDKRRSSNAIVFVPIKPAVQPNVTTECHDKETPNNAKESSNTYVTDVPIKIAIEDVVKEDVNPKASPAINPNDKANLEASLPDGWFKQSRAYASDANDLYRITGELFKAKHATDLRVEDHVEEFGEVLRRSWVSLKGGRINRTKWYAYLFAAFKRTAHEIERRERFAPMQRDIEALFNV
ncbi:DNA-binding Lrp family transcriptional regulator [Sporosarcina psychrophila]|uniref:DNA-binding Lrp family transcriptional regulator n=1 Tax=Sporosarcina psychrophila TaxID=1476 RepID=A0ABV2KBJ6_SPOPS